ncbi:MAG: fibronectin type III domain-containing protein [Acidimicrobiales bacterium]|nr:fibronectin type III domain-containing protein [Acidimicrobiales bacterium]MYG62108.1 fibronectin type III domain-containing protein [Acidimicrobiales bacterium]
MSLRKRLGTVSARRIRAAVATVPLLVAVLAAGVAVGPAQAARAVPDGPIGQLAVEAVAHDSITVSWNEVNSPERYVISWWRNGAKNKTRVDMPVDGASYTIEGLKAGKQYTIRVFTVKNGKRHYKYRSELLTQRTLAAPQTPEESESTTAQPQSQAQQGQTALPRISLTAGAAITEGEEAVFHCVADPPPKTAIDGVAVTIAQVGDFTTHTTATLRIDTNADCGTIRIPTVNDAQGEPSGSIEATLQSDSRIDASTKTVIVVVVDDDQYENISISAGPDITEGEPAKFTITATPAPTDAESNPQTLTVPYVITAGQLFLKNPNAISGTVEIPASGSVVLSIPTDDDRLHEPDGTITVSLRHGGRHGKYLIIDHEASVAVASDDALPTLTVTAESASVEEGEPAKFTVTADPPALHSFPVKIDITSSGLSTSAQLFTDKTKTITIHRGVTATFRVGTLDDKSKNAEMSVTATLRANADRYTLGSASAATVQLLDNDTPPTVTIAADTAQVSEGDTAAFTITATQPPGSVRKAVTVDVRVKIDEGGQLADPGTFLSAGEAGTRTVTVPVPGSKTIRISTDDDSTRESAGLVTAALLAAGGYAVGDTATASVGVSDDDRGTLSVTPQLFRDSVAEGRPVAFEFRANPPPPGGVSLDVELTQVGEYVQAADLGSKVVHLDSRGYGWLEIDTHYRAADEADGTVTARILPADGWRLNKQSASATVENDPAERPVVTVSVDHDSYEEGQPIDFRFNVSPEALPYGLLIHYKLEKPNRFFRYDSASLATVIQVWGSHTDVVRTIGTVDDSTAEQHGTFTLTVLPHPTGRYTVGTASTVTGTIYDNDSPVPVVSIAADVAGIDEGDTASFTVSASSHPDSASTATTLTVPVVISQSGDYLASGQAGKRMVTVPIGGSVVITASTDDDSAAELVGAVHARLLAGDGFKLDTNSHTAVVKANDNEPKVAVSVQFEHTSVTEGSEATLKFFLSQSPLPFGLRVPYSYTGQGDFFNGKVPGSWHFDLPEGYVSGTVWDRTLVTVGDDADEPDGSFTLTLSAPQEDAGYVLADPHIATIDILDDD